MSESHSKDKWGYCPDGYAESNNCTQCVAESYETVIQRVRDLLDTEPLFTARQNPATMYGWRMALRHMIDALDGDGAWMKYPQLAEAPVKLIHDRQIIQRMRDLHPEEDVADYISHHGHCMAYERECEELGCEYYEGPWCHKCDEKFPCTERRILDGEQS